MIRKPGLVTGVERPEDVVNPCPAEPELVLFEVKLELAEVSFEEKEEGRNSALWEERLERYLAPILLAAGVFVFVIVG